MIRVKAPGKLYIAGEYAVTEPGYKSVLIAVNRFVTATIKASNEVVGTIHSKTLHHDPVSYNRNDNQIEISDTHAAKQLKYVVTAIEVLSNMLEAVILSLSIFI